MLASDSPKLVSIRDFLTQPHLGGKIVFAIKAKKGTTELSYAKLTQDTVNDYRNQFTRLLDKMSERKPVPYGLSDFDSDTYQYLPSTQIPHARDFLGDPQVALQQLDHEFISAIKFTEFRFQNTKGDVIGVFKIYLKTGFLTSQNRFKFIFQDSVLTPFTKDIIIAPPRFDCILLEDVIYIFNRPNFEKIFDYKRVFQEKATEVFVYFAKPHGYTVEGLDEIEQKCMKSRSKMRRLAIIAQGRLYKSLTFDKVASFCKVKELNDPILDSRKKIMKFLTPEAFLRIFDEDYVRGELTGTEYISTRKTLFKTPGKKKSV